MGEIKLGFIGGSGLYALAEFAGAEWRVVEKPLGAPSDELLHGELSGQDVVFLPRHGRGHVHASDSIPYRANIAALKPTGMTHLVSVSATGSFREEMAPRDFVFVDQFVERTRGRESSFFGAGLVAHVSLAHPVCPVLSRACATAARGAGATVRRRDVPGDRGAAGLHRRRIPALPILGLRRDRHDQHAGGAARTRGGATLRLDRDDHRP